MNVLVAAVGSKDCPAARALLTEGVECGVVVMENDADYGNAVAAMWDRGEEFCILEHDVVPWYGAMDAISGCPEPWCVYQYPFGPGKARYALGCLRVSQKLVQSSPDLPDLWRDVPWNQLDGRIYHALHTASGVSDPHIHLPALAHLKYHGDRLT